MKLSLMNNLQHGYLQKDTSEAIVLKEEPNELTDLLQDNPKFKTTKVKPISQIKNGIKTGQCKQPNFKMPKINARLKNVTSHNIKPKFKKLKNLQNDPVTNMIETAYDEKNNDPVTNMIETGYDEKNEKKHSCKMCSYISPKRFIVKRHVKTVHLKLKTYQCEYCGYGAAEKYHLINHQNLHHSDLIFQSMDAEEHIPDERQIINIDFTPVTADFNETNRTIEDCETTQGELEVQQCKLCSYISLDLANLENHMQFEHDQGTQLREEALEIQCIPSFSEYINGQENTKFSFM